MALSLGFGLPRTATPPRLATAPATRGRTISHLRGRCAVTPCLGLRRWPWRAAASPDDATETERGPEGVSPGGEGDGMDTVEAEDYNYSSELPPQMRPSMYEYSSDEVSLQLSDGTGARVAALLICRPLKTPCSL
jgi:hypothetical protein